MLALVKAVSAQVDLIREVDLLRELDRDERQ